MGTRTAEDLANDPRIDKYIDQIVADADAALDTLESNLKYAGIKHYPSAMVSVYKADGRRLDNAWAAFVSAWNKVGNGRAKNSKEIIKTYHQFVLALEILEQNNIRHSALVASDLARVAAAFLALLIRMIEEARRRCGELEKELKQLQKLAKTAKSNITEAQVQIALNVAITAISFCLGPVGLGARIGVAVGGLAVHAIIDASLGPSQGSAIGTANTVAGEATGVVEKLSPGAMKLAGGVSALVTLKMDFDEVGDAKKILKEITKRMQKASKDYQILITFLGQHGRQLNAARVGFNAAVASVRANAKRFRSARRKRQELLKEFRSWK